MYRPGRVAATAKRAFGLDGCSIFYGSGVAKPRRRCGKSTCSLLDRLTILIYNPVQVNGVEPHFDGLSADVAIRGPGVRVGGMRLPLHGIKVLDLTRAA